MERLIWFTQTESSQKKRKFIEVVKILDQNMLVPKGK